MLDVLAILTAALALATGFVAGLLLGLSRRKAGKQPAALQCARTVLEIVRPFANDEGDEENRAAGVLLESIIELLHPDAVLVYLFADLSAKTLERRAALGEFANFPGIKDLQTIPRDGTLFEQVVRGGKYLLLSDLERDLTFQGMEGPAGSLIALPVLCGLRNHGMVLVYKNPPLPGLVQEDVYRLDPLVQAFALVCEASTRTRLALEQNTIATERNISSALQKRMTPAFFPKIERASVAGYTSPGDGIYTDYHDFLTLKDGRCIMLLCDVAGRTIDAAFMAIVIRSLAHLLSASFLNAARIIDWINHTITHKMGMEQFASLSLLVFDPGKMTVQFAGAGGQPCLFFQHRNSVVEFIYPDPKPVGSTKKGKYGQTEFKVKAGDVFLLCTDGIPESTDSEGKAWGLEGVRAMLASNHVLSAEQLADTIKAAVTRHRQHQYDDESVVALKIR